MKSRIVISALMGIGFVVGLVLEVNPVVLIGQGKITSQAEARIGRPATPASVAGVSRRTTRRTIRRTSRYYATLPRGCTTVVVDGVSLYSCGGTYYQAYNNQYVVVIVE